MTTTEATEREYESTILDAARIGGWRVHAERPARSAKGWRTAIRGDAGWPDLILAHRPTGRLLAVELKRRPRRPTDEQVAWLDVLRACGVDARLVYVPDGLDALVRELVS